jgi:hypothetical protein
VYVERFKKTDIVNTLMEGERAMHGRLYGANDMGGKHALDNDAIFIPLS